ncbi:YmdB family metallophosphoesterase [bacterium]|nr:YmdB family metallophosphoesterase [bacterium]
MPSILFIGDITGRIGRQAVKSILPKLKKEYKFNLCFANAENSAHGSGITEQIAKELNSYGIDWMTTGDHAFTRPTQFSVFDNSTVIRPANFSSKVPGKGHILIPWIEKNGVKSYILLISLIGRIFMKMDHNCPFHEIDAILANDSLPTKKLSAIIVDVHAETTSEKINLGFYLNGRTSAVLGTHTHVMTADEHILNKGTAYITDVGMTGAADESLGIAKEGTIKTFLTQIKQPHVIPKNGRAIFNSVLVNIDPKTAKAKSIKRITRYIDIN